MPELSVNQMNSQSIWRVIRWPLIFVIVLWLIEGASEFFKIRFVELGIFPRAIVGLPGIIFSPFIHANYEHLLSNTLPLLVVGSGLVYFYGDIAKSVVLMIWLFTGFWVWLAARAEFHIGASGLIYGLVCFLFLSGILRRDTRLLAVSLLVTFLYGSMVWGILPVDQSISWESHLFGSMAGFFCAIYFRNLGPQRQKPQWEIDEELEMQNELTQETSNFDETISPSTDIIINYEYKKKDDGQDTKNSGS